MDWQWIPGAKIDLTTIERPTIGRPKGAVGKDSARKTALIEKAAAMPLKPELAAESVVAEYHGERIATLGSIKRKRQEKHIANRIETQRASSRT